MKIAKPKDKVLCTAPVKLARFKDGTLTRTARHRVYWASQNFPDGKHCAGHCGRNAGYLVDGEPRCLNHAGQEAIKYVMESQNG